MLDNNKYQDLIYYNNDAQLKLKAGIDKIVDAVKVTLGPYGRNVIFDNEEGPIITKDGVSVSNYIRLIDPIENMAAEILKQASRKTVEDVGDGTTTSMVLTQAIINNTNLTSITNINRYKKYLETLRDEVISYLGKNKTLIKNDDEELIKNILYTSSNQDTEVIDNLFNSFKFTGLDGLIRIEKSKQNATSIVYDSGYRLNRGLISSYFVNQPEDNCTVLNNALILIVSERLEQFKLVKPLLEKALESEQGLIIVAKDFSEEFIAVCAKNVKLGNIIIPIFAEGYNDDLIKNSEDLALYCDGEILTNNQLKEGSGRVGIIDEIKIGHNYTTIKSEVNKEKVVVRVKQLKNLLSKTHNEFSKVKLKDRISKLTTGVATINVGGYTEAEIKEKFDRYEDALGSMGAAVKHGILPGGGTALYKASQEILKKESLNEDYIQAVECLARSLTSPYNTILKNADIPSHKLKLSPFNVGYNLSTLEEKDMIKLGIVDPFLVTSSALRNAVSIATMIITTGCVAKNTETILL